MVVERKKTGSTLAKEMNRQAILEQVKQHGRLSRAELSKRTALSRPCVSSLVNEMMSEGVLYEVGAGQSSGGRKPILLEYNYQAQSIVGAVFEGSTLHMALSDLRGNIFARYETRLCQPATGETAISALEAGVSALLGQTGIERQRLLGIGVGLPGITQRRVGTISFSPSTGWKELPVQQEIERRLSIPAVIDNDVNMMAQGEYAQGVGLGAASVVYIYVGTGIGSGIIIDGQFYRGCTEAAGEIGYMMVGPVEERRDQEFGVFEKNYSVPGIIRKARELLSDLQEDASVIQQLIVHASQGNQRVDGLLEDIYRHWAYAMANIISVLNPELIVLSGEMIHMDDRGLEQIRALLVQWVPVMPQIKKAVLGNQAGMIGAVHSVLEAYPYGQCKQR